MTYNINNIKGIEFKLKSNYKQTWIIDTPINNKVSILNSIYSPNYFSVREVLRNLNSGDWIVVNRRLPWYNRLKLAFI